MIKLYGLSLSPPVNRVRMCLNAIGSDYEFVVINPLVGETQNDDYLKLSPTGKIPALDDNGFAVFESNAIMKYLCRQNKSDLYPDDIRQQAVVDEWLDLVGAHVNTGLVKVLFNKVVAGLIDADVDESSMQEGYGLLERFLTVIDKRLGESPYLAGDKLTIADFSLLGTVDPAEVIDFNIADYPNVDAWRKKLMSEDFYKKVHNSYKEALDAVKAG